jgi:hypothetical protein
MIGRTDSRGRLLLLLAVLVLLSAEWPRASRTGRSTSTTS